MSSLPFNDFTDLVLLVGTNPLPNYVVAKYFLQENKDFKKIWLVHSETTNKQQGTLELAKNIKATLEEEFPKFKDGKISMEFIALSDIGSVRKIEADLQAKLLPKLEGNKIHLNYTGGTKLMSVHVYRILEQKTNSNCSFSYLDARDFKLKDDQTGISTGDLRETITISLQNLLKLHGAEEIREREGIDEEKLAYFKNLVNEEEPESIKEELNKKKKEDKNGKAYDTCLEKYVYDLSPSSLVKTWGWKVKKTGSSKDFELDVILLNGYQVCGISCTIKDGEGDCKQKGFEIIHRVKQIGGDEAKAVLVTFLPDLGKEKLFQDLQSVSGVNEDKFKVLGVADLKEEYLRDCLREYIWGSD